MEVLILVLVEDGLGGFFSNQAVQKRICLNPCFSGGWSRRDPKSTLAPKLNCLNPCFSGGWSRRYATCGDTTDMLCLNPCFSGGWSRRKDLMVGLNSNGKVLILVLVEDGLGEMEITLMRAPEYGLNPCFSGGWSRSTFHD